MKRKLYSPDQIIPKVRTAVQLLNQYQNVADFCSRALEVSNPTYHRWRQL